MKYLQFKNMSYIKWSAFFVFPLLFSCRESSKFQFSGTVVGDEIESIFLAEPVPKDSAVNVPYKILDTIAVVDGIFEGDDKLSGSELRYFMVKDNANEAFVVFVGNGEKANLTLYLDSISKSKIEGSAINDEFQKLTTTINDIRKNIQDEYRKLMEDKTFSDEDRSAFENISKESEKRYDSVLDIFITRHKHDNLSAFGIVVKNKYDFERLTKDYDVLNKVAKNSFFGKEIKGILDRLRPFSAGSKIKDFALPDVHDSLFSLSSLKGKHVLLDFWMESNLTSRQSNKKLKNWHELYKSHGLEIVSLSIDRDKSKWRKAIQEDQMNWTQVHDSIGATLSDYGVVTLPHKILIDPKGVILKVVQGNDQENKMENKLEEVFAE